jgi:PII-like signaling protein
VSINYPLIIEVVDEQSKLEPLLPQIRRMVNDNGLVTVQEVYAL